MHFGRSGRANELSHHSVAAAVVTQKLQEMAKNVLKAMCGTMAGTPLLEKKGFCGSPRSLNPHTHTHTHLGVSVSRAVAKGNSSCSHSHIPYTIYHIPYPIFPCPFWRCSISAYPCLIKWPGEAF